MGAISVTLPDGREILIPAENAEEAEYQDVSFHLEFAEIVDTAREIGAMFHKALDAVKPRRAVLELSLGVDAKTGKITAFFVDGGGSGKIKLLLEWGSPTQVSS